MSFQYNDRAREVYLELINRIQRDSNLVTPNITSNFFEKRDVHSDLISYSNRIQSLYSSLNGSNISQYDAHYYYDLVMMFRETTIQFSHESVNEGYIWRLYVLYKVALEFNCYQFAKNIASSICSLNPGLEYPYYAIAEAMYYEKSVFKMTNLFEINEKANEHDYNISTELILTYLLKQIQLNDNYFTEKETFYKSKSLILMSLVLNNFYNSKYNSLVEDLFKAGVMSATPALPLEFGLGEQPFKDEKNHILNSWSDFKNKWFK